MSDFLRLLLSLSLSGAIAALALVVLRRIFRDIVSKRWRYYAWLIVFARLLLPVTFPESPVGSLFAEKPAAILSEERGSAPEMAAKPVPAAAAGVGVDADAGASAGIGVGAGVGVNVGVVEKSAAVPAVSLPVALFAVWGVAALLLLTRKATQYQSFTQYLFAGSELVADPALLNRYAEVCERVGATRPPELSISPLITTPMLVGIRKPHIVLPAHIEEREMEKILLHELLHHTRHDALYKWFAQAVLCLHWFNPAVWYAVKAMERDCELACDEAVLSVLRPEEHRDYGDALLRAVQRKVGYSTKIARLALGEDAKQLKERLEVIMQYRKRTKIERSFAVCLALALCVGASAAGAYAATEPRPLSPAPVSSQPNEAVKADASTPEGTLALAMQAIKSLDIDALCRYSNNQKSFSHTLYTNPSRFNSKNLKKNPILFGGNTGDQKRFHQDIVRALTWEIGKTSVAGDTAKVELQITNRDFGDVMAEIISNSFLATASDLAIGDDKNDPHEIMLQMEQLIKAVPDSKTITLTVSVEIRKENGRWKLYLNDALANAVCGNLFDGVESPASKAKIDAATEKLNQSIEKNLEGLQAEIDAALKEADISIEQDQKGLRAEIDAALKEADIAGQVREAMKDAF